MPKYGGTYGLDIVAFAERQPIAYVTTLGLKCFLPLGRIINVVIIILKEIICT